MGLLDSAADGSIGAVIAGAGSFLLIRRSKPNREQYQKQWDQQTRELKKELAAERADNDRTQQAYTSNLLGQIQAKDLGLIAKDKQLQSAQAEIARLQLLLGRAQRKERDD